MNITELTLTDFRNYKRQSVGLCPFVNLVVGENAQGKTNLLEAVYLSAVGRSPRTPRDKEMIRFDCDAAKIKVSVKKSFGTEKVEVVLSKSANKRIAINNLPIMRMGELMGVVAIVFFSPDELRIVKESPSDRRRFMDIALSQISRNYFYLLSRYNKIIAQRNRLLKSFFSKKYEGTNINQINDALIPWDLQLSEAGALIIKTRRGFVGNLSTLAAEEHKGLTGGENGEMLSLVYESIEGATRDEIKENYMEQLSASRERDVRLGVTHIGPHKDDMGIFIGGSDARKYGSQGQQRTAALSIKLAEAALSAREKGEKPILLLDDVMGELDQNRQRALLLRIQGMQSVITCTHLEPQLLSALGEHRIIRIKNGTIKP